MKIRHGNNTQKLEGQVTEAAVSAAAQQSMRIVASTLLKFLVFRQASKA